MRYVLIILSSVLVLGCNLVTKNQAGTDFPHILLDESFVLEADNGDYFTAGELIYKINIKTSANLKDNEHVFFEGLEYVKNENDIPVYRIAQGS